MENTTEKLSYKKLVGILRNYSDYSEDEVKAAYQELEKRGLLEDTLKQLKNEVRDGKILVGENQAGRDTFRDFNPNRMKTFRTGSTQQIVFEQKLITENIPYYRQEALDVIIPLVYYYFSDNDFAKADQLEIETMDYVDNLPVEKRNYGTKRAGSAVLWILAFFVVFLLVSIFFRWLRGV